MVSLSSEFVSRRERKGEREKKRERERERERGGERGGEREREGERWREKKIERENVRERLKIVITLFYIGSQLICCNVFLFATFFKIDFCLTGII